MCESARMNSDRNYDCAVKGRCRSYQGIVILEAVMESTQPIPSLASAVVTMVTTYKHNAGHILNFKVRGTSFKPYTKVSNVGIGLQSTFQTP